MATMILGLNKRTTPKEMTYEDFVETYGRLRHSGMSKITMFQVFFYCMIINAKILQCVNILKCIHSNTNSPFKLFLLPFLIRTLIFKAIIYKLL